MGKFLATLALKVRAFGPFFSSIGLQKSWKEVDWVEELLREVWFCSPFSCQTAETSGLIEGCVRPKALLTIFIPFIGKSQV